MPTETVMEGEAEPVKPPEVVEAMEAEMIRQGASTTTPVQADYFACDETYKVMLPDGISWIEHKILNEGERRKYLNAVNRDVKLQRSTGDAIVRMQTGDEKHALLEAAIINWNLKRGGQDVPFGKGSKGHVLNQWLEAAPPHIIDIVEKDVRKHNPWLLQELTIEEIDKQIVELQEMRETKIAEEAGKDF